MSLTSMLMGSLVGVAVASVWVEWKNQKRLAKIELNISILESRLHEYTWAETKAMWEQNPKQQITEPGKTIQEPRNGNTIYPEPQKKKSFKKKKNRRG